MSKTILHGAAVLWLSLAVTGCHARWFPLASAPGFSIPQESAVGELNKEADLTLSDEDNHYVAGVRYELPAAGSLIASATPANPAARITLSVHSGGSGEAVAKSDGKKVEATGLQPGTYYYVVIAEPWREAVRTRVGLTTVFKPADPDQSNGAYKSQPGARELQAENGNVSDTVDYSGMRRTNWWKVPLTGEGGLTIRFNPDGTNLSAEFVPPQGAPEKIDPAAGLVKPDLPAGDYFVKVTANDAGDHGKYTLTTAFTQGDTCKNGGPACSLEGAEELKLPADSKTSEVDYARSKQFHFYRLSIKEKGKLTLNFRVLPPRGSRIGAFLMKAPDDDGEKIGGGAQTRGIDTPGDLFIRVQAPEPGDYGKYALATIFAPDNFISGDVVEVGKAPCMLTVGAGTNQNVRLGAACTIVNASGQAIDGCVVDQVFPNLSKVRPSAPGCRIPQISKVQIAAQ